VGKQEAVEPLVQDVADQQEVKPQNWQEAWQQAKSKGDERVDKASGWFTRFKDRVSGVLSKFGSRAKDGATIIAATPEMIPYAAGYTVDKVKDAGNRVAGAAGRGLDMASEHVVSGMQSVGDFGKTTATRTIEAGKAIGQGALTVGELGVGAVYLGGRELVRAGGAGLETIKDAGTLLTGKAAEKLTQMKDKGVDTYETIALTAMEGASIAKNSLQERINKIKTWGTETTGKVQNGVASEWNGAKVVTAGWLETRRRAKLDKLGAVDKSEVESLVQKIEQMQVELAKLNTAKESLEADMQLVGELI